MHRFRCRHAPCLSRGCKRMADQSEKFHFTHLQNLELCCWSVSARSFAASSAAVRCVLDACTVCKFCDVCAAAHRHHAKRIHAAFSAFCRKSDARRSGLRARDLRLSQDRSPHPATRHLRHGARVWYPTLPNPMSKHPSTALIAGWNSNTASACLRLQPWPWRHTQKRAPIGTRTVKFRWP